MVEIRCRDLEKDRFVSRLPSCVTVTTTIEMTMEVVALKPNVEGLMRAE